MKERRQENAHDAQHAVIAAITGLSHIHPLRYLAHYKARIIPGIFCLILSSGLTQLIPWIVKQTIEIIAQPNKSHHQVDALTYYAALIIGLVIVQTLVRIASRILIFNAARDAEHDLRQSIFDKLVQLDPSFFDQHQTGDLMSRITNDLSAIRAFFGAGILHGSNTLFAYAVALPLMLSIDPILCLWALAPYPILLIGARFFAHGIYTKSHRLQAALAQLTSTVQEDLSGIRELKSYRLEDERASHFANISKSYLKEAIGLTLWRTGMVPFIGLGTSASIVLVLWFGGQKVHAGELSIGDLVAFNLYIGLLAWPTMAIGWMLSLWQRGVAAWKRLDIIFNAQSFMESALARQRVEIDPSKAILSFRNLSLKRNDKTILDNICFDIPKGEIIGIVGKIASGKSTLAEICARLIDVAPNQVFYSGHDFISLSPQDVHCSIAYAPQDAFLFSASIFENIAFGMPKCERENPQIAIQKVKDAAKAAGLEADLHAFADGLETIVGERGIVLSGGQRQRVALARALASMRPLIILDDSLSAVDAQTEEKILKEMSSTLQGRTAIIISHRLSALQHASLVIVLDQGEVVQQGPPSRLLKEDGLYAELYKRQELEAAYRQNETRNGER